MFGTKWQDRVPRPGHVTARAGLWFLSLLACALAWELSAHRINSLLLPSFTETLAALASLITREQLWIALWTSNQAMVLGFLLAATVGILAGLLMGRWRAAERYVEPYLNILLATSKSALIPIVIMAVGLGLMSRVLVVFTYSVVIITVNVRSGFRMIDPAWLEMAQSLGATELQLWRKILLPGASPAILVGLRLGLARAISGMVTVELLLVALGIGRLILQYQGTLDVASLYATVLVVVAEAVVLLQACLWLERRVTPWVGEGVVR